MASGHRDTDACHRAFPSPLASESRGTLPNRGFRSGIRRKMLGSISTIYWRAFPILASDRDMPQWDDWGFGMRRVILLGLIIGGIALSTIGLMFTLLILQARNRCSEAGLESCVALGFQPYFAGIGVVLAIVGALLFRRSRRGSPRRA